MALPPEFLACAEGRFAGGVERAATRSLKIAYDARRAVDQARDVQDLALVLEGL